MIKITILYPNTEGKKFDTAYYVNVHMPLSIEKQGADLKRTEVEIGIPGPQAAKAPFIALCHFYYETVDKFVAAFMPHAELLTADIKNYTNIEPVVQISEIMISR